MKFSLLFLVMLLIWSALLVNGWVKNQQCVQLDRSLEFLVSKTEKIVAQQDLSPIDELKRMKETSSVKTKVHALLVEAAEKKDYEATAFGADDEFCEVLTLRSIARSDRREDRYKIRVPADRKVVIEAQIESRTKPDKTRNNFAEIAAGEYELRVSSERAKSEQSDEIEIQYTLMDRSESRPASPVIWKYPVNFRINRISGGLRKVSRRHILKPGNDAIVGSRSFNDVTAKVLLRDITKNE